ncbi:MAG: DNA-directed RNA polymerase subunit B'' [Candidatus Pacearchaeota archaeon]
MENIKKNKHILIEKFIESHSLIESNIKSFDDFIENRLQEIAKEVSSSFIPSEEGIEIKINKIKVGKPNIKEADGSINNITPTEARLRNLTYSSPIYVEISLKSDGKEESYEVEIGRIPILVKSKICNTYGMNKEELEKNYLDSLDPGGYFIINGNERIMVLIEDLASNQPFIEKIKGKLVLRIFSSRGSYRIPTSISENNNGIIEVSFSRMNNIPAIILLKALGMIKEADIAKYIGKETDNLIINLYEFTNITNSEDALIYLAEKLDLQGTKREVVDRIKQRIDKYFLPHVGTEKNDRIEKAITLCKFIKQFFIAKENPDVQTDKDHYANKRVRLSGDLLSDLFRVNLTIFLRDLQYSFSKIAKRGKVYSLKTIAKSTLFSHRIESAIATGSWIGERTGVTQNMDKTNYFSILSHLQRVSSLLSGEQENFMARTLHPTHYGRFCPIETPEGKEIGLRKNLALLAKISTPINIDEKQFLKKLKECGMKEKEENLEYDIFWNGKFIGSVNNGLDFVKKVRESRRKNIFPEEMSIFIEEINKIIIISTDAGRVLRPLIIVEDGKSKLTEEYEKSLEEGKISWLDLIKNGIIEYLDASEEENALVALNKEDLTQEHTHLEIDHVACLGVTTSLAPYANHNQASRLLRGSKTFKQALGVYSLNYPVRIDTDVHLLHYPQKPIVKSFVYDKLKICPVGQNVVVAVMTYEGYNMEDAIILNKASVNRGLGRSTYFRPYTSVELHYPGGLKDFICIPEKDVAGYRTEESYKYLEDDGISYIEAELKEGDVVIGKISPPKFLSETKEITIKTSKENSSVIRQEEKGIIDGVFITIDNEGDKVVHVRTRDHKIPELGDKFATPHGQKGVVGLLLNEEDVPFTARGIKPDIIFNPHGLPSRMSVGYLLDLLAGKVGSLSARYVDATPFSAEKPEDLENELKNLGFRYDGKETMYDPITGKMMKTKIYIGEMHYLKLKYMVSNKIHSRALGKVQMLTRQPVEGRAKGGALRLGEMEQEALVAHGASLLLKERYDSDKVIIYICDNCGAIATKDYIKNKVNCRLCNSHEISPVEISYAFKLLLEELNALHISTKFGLKNKFE